MLSLSKRHITYTLLTRCPMTTHHSPFIVKTNIKDLPTSELLQALVGHPTAHALTDRPLAELFALHPVPRVSDNLSQSKVALS